MRVHVLLAGLILAAAGCQKERSLSPAPSASVQAPASADAPAPEPDLSSTLSQLTQAVRRYAAEQQRVPQNLEEVAAGGYLNGVPAPPPGKQFAISKKLEVYVAKR